jgi:hypothetical protein
MTARPPDPPLTLEELRELERNLPVRNWTEVRAIRRAVRELIEIRERGFQRLQETMAKLDPYMAKVEALRKAAEEVLPEWYEGPGSGADAHYDALRAALEVFRQH